MATTTPEPPAPALARPSKHSQGQSVRVGRFSLLSSITIVTLCALAVDTLPPVIDATAGIGQKHRDG